MAIGYDATRLFLGPLSLTPRGIDRIEMEYARHFFRDSAEDCFAVLPTPWGMRCYPREQVLRGLKRLEELWPEQLDPNADPAWLSLQDRVRGIPDEHGARGPRVGLATQARRMTSLLRATGITLGSDVGRTLPQGSIYLNIGQVSLAIPLLLRWLRQRADVRPVFMLHDVIPLQTPEYVEPAGVSGHVSMVKQTVRHAAGLIVSTQAAKRAIGTALAEHGAPALPTLALPFPVPSAFREAILNRPLSTAKPYFLVCGAIEPRKNHQILVEVWKKLHARLGPETPLLIIAGASGWQGQIIESRIRRTPVASNHIHIAKGLSTAALKHAMAGAAGLLMPSFIEGFGLPIVEAASLGTPIVASDIEAHREVAPPSALLVDPIDGPGWERAILSVLDRRRPATAADRIALRPSADTSSATWQGYFAQLTEFTRSLEQRSGTG